MIQITPNASLPTVRFISLGHGVTPPTFATDGSMCFDISAAFVPVDGGKSVVHYWEEDNIEHRDFVTPHKSWFIPPRCRAAVPTGFKMEIPKGWFSGVRVYARSGLSLKKGLCLVNGVGVIDADYRDEVKILLHNTSNTPVEIRHGDRIAQGELVVKVAVEPMIWEIESTPGVVTSYDPRKSVPRTGGFGSTGVTV